MNLRNKRFKNELLRRNLVIYFFNDFATKQFFFQINHNNFNARHFAQRLIEKNIKFKYY